MIAAAPAWLLKLIGSKPVISEQKPRRPPELHADEMIRAKAYAEAAFRRERERLRKAPVHQRNDTLNMCGFKLGRFVARGLLDSPRVSAKLTQIAKAIGLEESEIPGTVDSGLKAGMKNPARLPFEKGVSQKIANRPPTDPGEELTRQLAAMGEDDIANAERFARRCGHKVVFSPTLRLSGFRWKTVPGR